MASDPADVRERAWVDHRRPPLDRVSESKWIAEDPVTECVGVGDVEAEAVGNLVAVVAAYEDGGGGPPRMKLPGRVVTRPSARSGPGESVLERLRSLF